MLASREPLAISPLSYLLCGWVMCCRGVCVAPTDANQPVVGVYVWRQPLPIRPQSYAPRHNPVRLEQAAALPHARGVTESAGVRAGVCGSISGFGLVRTVRASHGVTVCARHSLARL